MEPLGSGGERRTQGRPGGQLCVGDGEVHCKFIALAEELHSAAAKPSKQLSGTKHSTTLCSSANALFPMLTAGLHSHAAFCRIHGLLCTYISCSLRFGFLWVQNAVAGSKFAHPYFIMLQILESHVIVQGLGGMFSSGMHENRVNADGAIPTRRGADF